MPEWPVPEKRSEFIRVDSGQISPIIFFRFVGGFQISGVNGPFGSIRYTKQFSYVKL